MRRKFEKFCYLHRQKGIPNLMLYITAGSLLCLLYTQFSRSLLLYDLLAFDREAILRGQLWRLLSFPIANYSGNLLTTLLMLYCYYFLGRSIENLWGTLKFNLFYLCGVLMMDVYCMLLPGAQADAYYLNMSLFLAYATMFPDATFLLFFIIPVKAWIFAVLDLVVVVFGLVFYPFPINLFSVISLANYFLFMGKDVVNVLPLSWRLRRKAAVHRTKSASAPKTIPFSKSAEKADYNHRCTVCGRTDISNPELDFRYCSRCAGYHCYCSEHISNHSHILE